MRQFATRLAFVAWLMTVAAIAGPFAHAQEAPGLTGSLYFSAWWDMDARGAPRSSGIFGATLPADPVLLRTFTDYATRLISPDGHLQAAGTYQQRTLAITKTDDSHRPSVSVALAGGVPPGGAGGADGASFSWLPDGSALLATLVLFTDPSQPEGTQFVLFDSALSSNHVLAEVLGPAVVGTPSISEDGSLLAYSQAGGDVWLQPPAPAERIRLSKRSSQYQRTTAWSPDASQLAFFEQGDWKTPPFSKINEWTLVVAGSDGGNYRPIATFANTAQPGLSWSPDGTKLAVVAPNVSECCSLANLSGTVSVIDVATQTLHQVTDFQTGQDSGWTQRPAWSPDGNYIAYGASETSEGHLTPHIVDVTTSDRTAIAIPEGASIYGGTIVWAP